MGSFSVEAFGFGVGVGNGDISNSKYNFQQRNQYQNARQYGIPLMDDQLRLQDTYNQIQEKRTWANDRDFRRTAVPDMVKGAQKAGIHPLLAMGGGGGSFGPSQAIGPQNVGHFQPNPSRGSTGVTSVKLASPAEKAAVEESKARTQLLKQQQLEIAHRMGAEALEAYNRQSASTQNDLPLVRDPPDRIMNPAEGKPGSAITSSGKKYTIPSGTPQSVLENEIGEWADWMPDTVKRAYSIFKSQSQNPATVKNFQKWAAKNKLWDVIPEKDRYKFGWRKHSASDMRRTSYPRKSKVKTHSIRW